MNGDGAHLHPVAAVPDLLDPRDLRRLEARIKRLANLYNDYPLREFASRYLKDILLGIFVFLGQEHLKVFQVK